MDNSPNSTSMSIVRRNLLTRENYTPYCGAIGCCFGYPRTKFNGEQFECRCGWKSSFDAEFIENYKNVLRGGQ